ncbi:MAG: glucose-6-phosphate dehydrogenase assembly protein OpcA, partial [Waterburya sp.]
MVSPIVSLQAPKDVSIDEIEAELRSLWQNQGSDEDSAAVTRAATFSLIVYETDGTQQLLASLGFYTGPIDGISGPRIKAAIKAAQKEYGLEVTGKSDAALLDRLQKEFRQAKVKDTLTPENKTAAVSYTPDSEGITADVIAASNPCRIVTLCPIFSEDTGVTAQVSAYCPINKQSQNTLVCCEYITLSGTS